MHTSNNRVRRCLWILPVFIVVSIGIAGCKQPDALATAAPSGIPAVEVGVINIRLDAVSLEQVYTGRLEASRVAQVRAQATGIVQERLFQEGSDVHAGQTLFRIDPAPYDVALAAAQGQWARAQAQWTQAVAQRDRFRPLLKEGAVSEETVANAEAAVALADAERAVAQAAVNQAALQRSYANVTAPIRGRIGRALATEGALVGQSDPTPLAVIQQIDPLFVNFNQPAREALRLAQNQQTGVATRRQVIEVQIITEDGQAYPIPGRLLFTEASVSEQTGEVILRAELPNPDKRLLPGLFVRVRMAQSVIPQAVWLPQQAVTRTAEGDRVTVVGLDGMVAPRSVTVGGQRSNQWLVVAGLSEGEQVMVDGFQKLFGNGPVKAVPWTPAGSAH
jgi:membrane fusion protein (multidrug efflux system)